MVGAQQTVIQAECSNTHRNSGTTKRTNEKTITSNQIHRYVARNKLALDKYRHTQLLSLRSVFLVCSSCKGDKNYENKIVNNNKL